MFTYALGVGSNRGQRAAILDAAAARLDTDPRLRLLVRSRAIENPAVGGRPGDAPFLNAVWLFDSDLGPHQVLQRLQALERSFGRVRTVRHGARSLDCDLLLRSDGLCCCSPVLSLPHPRIHQRSFVLAPLAEVAGDWRHPWFGRRIAALWADFPGIIG